MAGQRPRKTKAASGDERPAPGGTAAPADEADQLSPGSVGEAEGRPIRRYEAPHGVAPGAREVEGFDETARAEAAHKEVKPRQDRNIA